MHIKNVQELEDKTVVFEGEMSQHEHSVVVSFGLNALMSLGLLQLIPSVKVEEFPKPDEATLN